ncbi:MAG: hypothetical protein GY697_16935 [Desulfobacterales bacterium]|nr:hypothetical protein [Desulfobacterales bacterium]
MTPILSPARTIRISPMSGTWAPKPSTGPSF